MASIRLTFESIGSELELLRSERFLMRAPPSSPQLRDDVNGGAGVWIELRDAQSSVLYARVIDPGSVANTVEVPSALGEPSFMRVPAGEQSHLLVIVVPVLEGTESVHIFRRNPDAEPRSEPETLAMVTGFADAPRLDPDGFGGPAAPPQR